MKTVIIAGHCYSDSPRLAAIVEKAEAKPIILNSSDEIKACLNDNPESLCLLNRIFENGEEGLKVIKELKQAYPNVKFMLISNYDDAQQEAITLGAIQGFGKYKLKDPNTIDVIKNAL